MKKPPVKVRFAPSPTGLLNLGGVRSALFNWLFARNQNGLFILRYEDTDRARYVTEAENQILDSLTWLGLAPDEEPVKQSDRLKSYRQYADQLIAIGSLYPCWCSPERLDNLRHAAQLEKKAFKYDRYCLTHPGDLKLPHVLRFKIPDDTTEITWDDAVKGQMTWQTHDLDDFVALKSDGFPTYHLANIIDDHLMKITHVLRADEWLPSTPKHLLLYAALDWQAPVFAHLPAVLGQDKSKKLSKRHGAKPVLDYREEGYLPEAVINFLALLGWNAGEGSTKEIYTRDELIAAFSLGRIQKSPAVFDPERLDWINGLYIRQLPLANLADLSEPFWPGAATEFSADYKISVLQLVQERLKKLSELPELTSFFFHEPSLEATLFNIKQLTSADAKNYLECTIKLLEANEDHFESIDTLENALRGLLKGEKPFGLFMTMRVSISGQTATPPLFEMMMVLGRDKVLTRFKTALNILR